MTPFELDILLHYYSRDGEHDVVFDNPPIWEQTRHELMDAELLARSNDPSRAYSIGERGRVLIEAMLNLPLPVWSMPKH